MLLPYPVPADDDVRLEALAEYHLMDTESEEAFDRLAALAARLFDVPIVLISLVGSDRQFYKARVGLDLWEGSRETSFCAHAIMQDDILVIPDAAQDPRFASNPLVLGTPYVRFYAGKPLVTPRGARIGSVCLIDSMPRDEFTAQDRRNLTELAALVMDRMEMRRRSEVSTVDRPGFESIAAASPDAIICANATGHVTFWNRSAERLFGYGQEEILDQPVDVLVPESSRRLQRQQLESIRRGEMNELTNETIERSALRKDGTEFPVEISVSAWGEGDAGQLVAVVRDLTTSKQDEQRLSQLASIDRLTDLPNRSAWHSRLAEVANGGTPATVMLLDLDGFQLVNDALGHAGGDAVLKEVAERLRSTCSDALTIARIDGDEFAVLLPGNDGRFFRSVAQNLVSAISVPYDVEGERVDVGVSIGIALHPQHSSCPADLLNAADLALHRSKASGRSGYEVFDPTLRQVAAARRTFTIELTSAFENGEFELFYQPQVSTADERVVGAEALMRWNHPTRGLLTPVSFIDALGEKTSAAAVGEWVLRTACEQAATWRSAVPDFRMGVNLFEAQFQPGRLLPALVSILAETGLPAEALELEIVENILLRTDSHTLALLNDIRRLGVGLAFDDYGTGFASLSLLKRFPVSRLKIDRSFVRQVDTDRENAALVMAVLYLADSFGMEVIAEGVETSAELAFLRQNNCQAMQGYHFGAPVPAAEFSQRYIGHALP